MKKVIIAVLAFINFNSAMANTLAVTCHTDIETLKVYVDLKDNKAPHYIEIYSQGGLGPNFLDASFVATKSELLITPDDEVSVKSEFQNTKIDIQFNAKAQLGHGTMKSNTSKAIELNPCSYVYQN
jgi:hypothetical protein